MWLPITFANMQDTLRQRRYKSANTNAEVNKKDQRQEQEQEQEQGMRAGEEAKKGGRCKIQVVK